MTGDFKFRGSQVPIHHHQHQVGATGATACFLFPLSTVATTFENSRSVHQLQPPLEPFEAQPVSLRFRGRAHGGAHLANDFLEQGADQRRFPAGTCPEDHHGEVTPLKFLGDPLPFLA